LSDLKPTDIPKIHSERTAAPSVEEALAIRVSPHSYLTGVLLGTYLSAFFFYLQIDVAGAALFVLSWIVIPFLALNDHVSFDGKRLTRTGLVPRAWAWFNRSRRTLRLSDVEQAETHAVRALKRGGNVFYRYRTVLRGKGLSITIASGGEDYRRLIQAILPRLSDNVLDNRSLELRDHLADPREALLKAESAHIPSAEVLEGSLKTGVRSKPPIPPVSGPEKEKADYLRSLANELRLSGHLLQALEAFRRALILRPRDGRLLFEFARCLYSLAGTTRDRKLERRAFAASRLSERNAAGDSDLLVRLAEWYYEIGNWQRAGSVFRRVSGTIGDSFRAARGMAEIALREGKIAHVVHHFAAAGRIAETPALRRWSRGEADYFSNLNSDDEYMEMEISRVNLLDGVERSKRTVLRIAFLAFPTVLIGVLFEDRLVANLGWAVSAVALLIWTGLIITSRILSQRIPYELVVSDEGDE
jgi:tetratricopeptide (TPR) repeat protein